VANGNEVKVEGIRSFALELPSGFNPQLNDVLISISRLDNSRHM
jgi:hypothetical protein